MLRLITAATAGVRRAVESRVARSAIIVRENACWTRLSQTQAMNRGSVDGKTRPPVLVLLHLSTAVAGALLMLLALDTHKAQRSRCAPPADQPEGAVEVNSSARRVNCGRQRC